MSEVRIEFVRLTEVPVELVAALLNEPRNARHMPLSNSFTAESAVEWVQAKDAQWSIHGYGPWAVLVNSTFAGWGGFQHEENGADFALVLNPEHWGLGGDIARAALDRGFGEFGLDSILIDRPAVHEKPGPRRTPVRVRARRGGDVWGRNVPAVPADQRRMATATEADGFRGDARGSARTRGWKMS